MKTPRWAARLELVAISLVCCTVLTAVAAVVGAAVGVAA